MEQGGHLVLFQFCADDTQTARHFGAAAADIVLKRHVIEMNPSAVNGGNNALGPKNGAVAAAVQRSQGCIDFLIGKLAGSFCAPGGKYLVGVVVMFMVMFMMMFMFMAVLRCV